MTQYDKEMLLQGVCRSEESRFIASHNVVVEFESEF
jgi:hypothetical protein